MPRSRATAALTSEESAPLFAALGDPIRLGLVARLCEQGPLSITKLSSGSPITRQAVTKHLHVLAAAGLVQSEREGREHVWELRPTRLAEARRYLDIISLQWDDALDRLRELVER
jgi:DNA-binding transcriptional ArsR family regulator